MRQIFLILALVSLPARAIDRKSALAAARKAGEAALVDSYKKWSKTAPAPSNGKLHTPRRRSPFLEIDPTKVSEDTASGRWTFIWDHHPPAGFEYDAHVTVDKSGKASVVKANASFAPE